MVALSVGVHGYLYTEANVMERILFVIAGLLMIDPGLLTDVIGIGTMLTVGYIHWRRSKVAASVAV